MNFFKKIKKFFSHDVEMDNAETQSLITPHPLKKGFFKMGARLNVPDDFELMVVHKNKITDLIKSGEYQISPLIMPNLGAKLEVWDNKNTKRKKQKRFVAEAYYVKKATSIPLEITNYRRLKYLGEPSSFNVKFGITFTTKITSILKFGRVLLKEYGKISESTAEHFLLLYSTQSLTDGLDKQSYSFEQFSQKDISIETYLKDTLKKNLNYFGIELLDFNITKLETKQKIKKEKTNKDKFITRQESTEVKANTKPEQKESIKEDTTTKADTTVLKNIDTDDDEEEVKMYDDEQESKPSKKNKEFVDLSLEHLYDEKDSNICPACGAKNRKAAITCYKCGIRLRR